MHWNHYRRDAPQILDKASEVMPRALAQIIDNAKADEQGLRTLNSSEILASPAGVDIRNSPLAVPGEQCPVSFITCFGCPCGIMPPQHLPLLVALYDELVRGTGHLTDEEWQNGPVLLHAHLQGALAKYTPEEIEQARDSATEMDTAIARTLLHREGIAAMTMEANAPIPDLGGSIDCRPDIPALTRIRKPAADGSIASFGDDVWNLEPMIEKPTVRAYKLRFTRAHPAFKDTCKRLMSCMLNRRLPLEALNGPNAAAAKEYPGQRPYTRTSPASFSRSRNCLRNGVVHVCVTFAMPTSWRTERWWRPEVSGRRQ